MRFEYIFTHTAPISFEPTWLFLPWINQSEVDKSMEIFLQDIYEEIKDKKSFKKWFFGHYHADCKISEKVSILYNDFIELE